MERNTRDVEENSTKLEGKNEEKKDRTEDEAIHLKPGNCASMGEEEKNRKQKEE